MKSVLSSLFLALTGYLALAQTPVGDIVGPIKLTSRVYPGTTRDYWIYVPKQYDASSPACLMVVQDGLGRANGWRLPQVMDSLIAAHRIPVMIGVFVDPGYVPAASEGSYPRYNRSLEYDALGDRYATFLAQELLPEVEKRYNIKKDPDSRAIAGASSGAICAFNVAWERPEQFRRVLSTIGTYVGLRGADEFTTLVRKSETKPIRVFLEDGNNDLNIYAGDWWTANQAMLSALTYAGYEVQHSWGNGGHDSKHASTIMGEAMDWLWKDYPAPITTHKGVKPRMDLLIDGESWKEISLNGQRVGQFTAAPDGNLYFVDKGTLYKIDQQHELMKVTSVAVDMISSGASGLFGWVKDSHRIVMIDNKGKLTTLASHADAEIMYTTTRGIYFNDGKKRQIGYYDFARKAVRYFTTDFIPAAMALSAEKTFLTVASPETPFGHSFKVNEDGTIDNGQPYVHYHVAYGRSGPGVNGMDVDVANALYSTTDLGIQVSDQLGRVNFIFSKATRHLDDVKLVGDKLYVSGEGRLFVRKINAQGLRSFDAPATPPKPQM